MKLNTAEIADMWKEDKSIFLLILIGNKTVRIIGEIQSSTRENLISIRAIETDSDLFMKNKIYNINTKFLVSYSEGPPVR